MNYLLDVRGIEAGCCFIGVMAVVHCSESQDHVLLQYYKLGNGHLSFNETPPNAQVIGKDGKYLDDRNPDFGVELEK